LVFDIEKMQVVRHTSVLSDMSIRPFLRKSLAGFVEYTLTRTSEVFVQKGRFFDSAGDLEEIAKYQISTQYFLPSAMPKNSEDDELEEALLRSNPAACFLELTEYCVYFSPDETNRIRLIGRKNMYVSDISQINRKDSFDQIFIIPYFDKKGTLKGSQLVLREDDQVILMVDQEINNLYQQQSATIQYGYQKFLTAEDSHEEYILVVSSQLRQKVYMNDHFENSESFWIHQKVQKKLMSQQLAKFEYFVLNDDFDALMREEFFQSQEVLEGKSINDLCLTFPREIAIGLKQEYEQYSNIRGSLAEELSNADTGIMEMYEKIQVCEKNLLIQLDFNFCSTLRIAAELNANQSVKILLHKIFEMNDISYQTMMMMELPRMLQLPCIDRLYDFLERDYHETLEIEEDNKRSLASAEKQFKAKFLNFEDFLNHPNLPPFMADKVNYHIKERFADYHNSEKETIDEVVEKNPYMTWSIGGLGEKGAMTKDKTAKQEKNIEVEHSQMDFTKMIIGEKVRHI